MATADIYRGEVVLLDRDSGRVVRRLDTGLGSVGRVAFAPFGRLLAIGPGSPPHMDRLVASVWDPDTGREIRRFDDEGRFTDDGGPFAFSPDGKLLATTGSDQIIVWDVATGAKRFTVYKPNDKPNDEHAQRIEFSPDGRMLIRAGGKFFTVWELISGEIRHRLRTTRGTSDAVACSPDSRWIAVADGDDVSIWDSRTGESRRVFVGHNAPVTALAFSNDGKRLASGGDDTNIMIWDMNDVKAARPKAATVAEASAAWNNLAAFDAAVALAAMRILADNPTHGLPLLRQRLQPEAAVDTMTVTDLLSKLAAASFAEREKAQRALRRLGDRAKEPLQALLKSNPSAEARRRARQILDGLNEPIRDGDMLRGLRAVEALEWIGTEQARIILRKVASGDAASRLTIDAKATLRRLGDSSVAAPAKQSDNERR